MARRAIQGLDDATQARVVLQQGNEDVHAPVLSIGLQPLDATLTALAAVPHTASTLIHRNAANTAFHALTKPWASIEEYLTGARTDFEALEAALADARSIWIPKGELNIGTELAVLSAQGQRIFGEGKYLSRIVGTGMGGVLQFGTTAANWIDGALHDIGIVATNGHAIVLPGSSKGAAMCHFSRLYIKQNSADKSFINGVDSVWIDNHVDNFHFEHVSGATATGVHLEASTGSLISSNTWERGRVTYSGDYAFHVEHTGTSASYQYDNTFRHINFEVCRNGCVRLLGVQKARLQDLMLYDCDPVGDVLKDPIYLDRGTHGTPPLSRGIIVEGFERRSSTLTAGIYDIKVGSSGGVNDIIIRGGNNATLANYKIDLNSAPGAILEAVKNWTVDNKHSSTMAFRSNLGGVSSDITLGTDVIIARPSAGNLKLTASTATEVTGDLKLSTAGTGVEFSSGGPKLVYCATVTAIKAITSQTGKVAVLTEQNREGTFIWRSGNYSAEITADPSNGIYIKADNVASTSGAWVRAFTGPVVPEWFGGTTETAIQAMMTWAASFSRPIMVGFTRGGAYTVGALVNCDLPEGSIIDARGAKITCTHNGVAFDLNPDATATIPRTDTTETVTKRRIYWWGGELTNTNATKTASVGIQCYFMRGAYFIGTYITGFYAGWKFGGKDTYQFISCYTFNCTRGFWVPAAGVLYTSTLTGNDLIGVEWHGCHLSISGNEAGIYFENRVIGMKVKGGSINGEATVASIRLSDNPTLYSRNIEVDTHVEQVGTGGGILFVGGGSQGFRKVDIKGEMSSAVAGWKGIITDRVFGLDIDVLFIDGSGGGTEVGITLDANSRDITIDDGVRYNRTSTKFLSVATPVSLNGCARTDVTLIPARIDVAKVGINDGTTNLNPLTTSSLGTTTIDMSAIAAVAGIAASALPPISYDIGLMANDSGSAAAASNVFAQLFQPGGDTNCILRTDLRGVANSENRFVMGRVLADSNGDIAVAATATGASTMTLRAHLYGINR